MRAAVGYGMGARAHCVFADIAPAATHKAARGNLRTERTYHERPGQRKRDARDAGHAAVEDGTAKISTQQHEIAECHRARAISPGPAPSHRVTSLPLEAGASRVNRRGYR
ncbi:hypothetical protein D9M72_121840 [compost metagenome]